MISQHNLAIQEKGHLGPRHSAGSSTIEQKRSQWESRGVPNSATSVPLLTMMMRGGISFLKSTPGTDKLISTLD